MSKAHRQKEKSFWQKFKASFGNALVATEQQQESIPALMPVYRRSEIVLERGEGVYLYDKDGKKYLDFAAGIAVNSLGHCHPKLVAAVTEQAGKLWHCSNLYQNELQNSLAERLVGKCCADSVFFCNSGAEAVECGFKMVRRYHDMNGNPEKYRIITLEGAFHGRTLTAISAANKMLDGFEPKIDGFDQIPFNDIEALRKAITPFTAAIMFEPIQGEGGIRAVSDEFLQEVKRLADKFDLLLYFDEVQCGYGRTGQLFAHSDISERLEIEPDIVAVAKGIGSGFPLGACLAKEDVARHMTPGTHGSTYGGNPLAMAVGHAVLDVFDDEDVLGNVQEIAPKLKAALEEVAQKHPDIIKNVRGIGLILGLVLADDIPNRLFMAELRKFGMMSAAAAGNVIRILPPLIITEEHIAEAKECLIKTCEFFEKQDSSKEKTHSA